MESVLCPEVQSAFLQLVEERYGLRAAAHQARHLDQAVAHLVRRSGYSDAEQLLNALRTGWRAELLEELVAKLTVGETHFFRVAPQIEALQRVVIPDLTNVRGAERRLALWSAGCSTGEEPYTLAILLREQTRNLDQWDIRIIATDISAEALKAAQVAAYGEWSFRDTPDDVRRRYFTREGVRWHLVESVRRMVQFGYCNLAGDVYPLAGPGSQGFDLILCRNVTIYFSAQLTQQIYRRFAGLLAPGGWLLLGPSDAIPDQSAGLEAVILPGAVVWRRPIAQRGAPAKAPAPEIARPLAPPRALPTRPSPKPAAPAVRQSNHTQPDLDRVRELVFSGERSAAREQAAHLVAQLPLEAEAHLLLGMLQLDSGELDPALESLRRATFLDAQNALAQFSLGRAYLLSGDQSRAMAALTHARRLLAALPDERPLDGGSGLTASELRQAVETHLALLNRVGA